MKERTCCFTGHREIAPEEEDEVWRRTQEAVEKLIAAGVDTFIAGGAFGYDMLAERVVLEMRKERPHIRLLLLLPCRGQERFWPEKLRREYQAILAVADGVEYVSDTYFKGCMQVRNRRMVEESAHCVCYLHEEAGGTAFTVRLAKKAGLSIENVAR